MAGNIGLLQHPTVWEIAEIRLLPENPEFSPIALSADLEGDFKIRAKFKEVLK
jgi:SOS-response transcriptional repressor LexA